MADVDSEKEFWNRRARTFDDDYVISARTSALMDGTAGESAVEDVKRHVSIIEENIRQDANCYLLDVACGNGLLARELSERYRVAGVDIAIDMLRRARLFDSRTDYVLGEGGRIPFQDSTFDCVICVAAFFLFPSFEYARVALGEMKRVVKPNGRIIIANVPARFSRGHLRYLMLQPVKWALGLVKSERNWLPYYLFYDSSFFNADRVIRTGEWLTMIIQKKPIPDLHS